MSDSFAGTAAKKATKEAQESSETQELKDRIKELEKTNDILLSVRLPNARIEQQQGFN